VAVEAVMKPQAGSRRKIGSTDFHAAGVVYLPDEAFTVSASVWASVRAYIANQEEHHRVKSFREELIDFLEKTGVTCDSRYLD
jgi:hypothetical protein